MEGTGLSNAWTIRQAGFSLFEQALQAHFTHCRVSRRGTTIVCIPCLRPSCREQDCARTQTDKAHLQVFLADCFKNVTI